MSWDFGSKLARVEKRKKKLSAKSWKTSLVFRQIHSKFDVFVEISQKTGKTPEHNNNDIILSQSNNNDAFHDIVPRFTIASSAIFVSPLCQGSDLMAHSILT